MRTIALAALLVATCMAQVTPFYMTMVYGGQGSSGTVTGTQALNSATTFALFSFYPYGGNKIVNSCNFFISAVTGTAANVTLRAEIVEDLGATPFFTVASTAVDTTADTFTKTSHGFSNGDLIRINTDTTMPGGVSTTTDYYACSVATDTFKLGTDAGCTATVDITTQGAGNHSVRHILGSTTTMSPTTPAAGTMSMTSLSASVNANYPYWCVIIPTNGAPATDFITIRYTIANTGVGVPQTYPGQPRFTFSKYHTTNGGPTITGGQNNCSWGWIGYSDTSKQGSPFSNYAVASEAVNNATQMGVRLTMPAGIVWPIRMVALMPHKTGTPTTDRKVCLYTVSGSTATQQECITFTNTASRIWNATGAGNTVKTEAWFSSVYYVAGGTDIIVAMADTGTTDTSANAYKLVEYTVDANGPAVPFAAYKVVCSGTCGTLANWTATSTAVFPFAVGVDWSGWFVPGQPRANISTP